MEFGSFHGGVGGEYNGTEFVAISKIIMIDDNLFSLEWNNLREDTGMMAAYLGRPHDSSTLPPSTPTARHAACTFPCYFHILRHDKCGNNKENSNLCRHGGLRLYWLRHMEVGIFPGKPHHLSLHQWVGNLGSRWQFPTAQCTFSRSFHVRNVGCEMNMARRAVSAVAW